MLVVLIVLTGILFFLMLFSIVQQNLSLFGLDDTGILSLKILDTNTSASLFVTLVGAILVRHQFALGLRPRVNYTSSFVSKSLPDSSGASVDVWQVVLHNAGSGSAIFNQIDFRIGLDNIGHGDFSKSHANVVQELAERSLVREKDYWLANISSGSTLSAKENRTIFEIKASKVHLVRQIDASIQFHGLLGDRYRREMFLIPRTLTNLKEETK